MPRSTPNLKAWTKQFAKRALRQLGIEAHGYIPGASREAQLAAAMRHFRIGYVLDIGANEGQFGHELLAAGYTGRIVSIEPLIEAHALLRQAAQGHAAWSIPDATAVGASTGEITFHVAANSVSSSALAVLAASTDAAPESRQWQSRTVPLTTVDQIVRSHPLPEYGAMLKVDTQGYESNVLDGAGESIGKFNLVLLELSLTELYVGQQLWLQLIERMAGLNFDVWSVQPEFVDPSTGRTLQVNGLFARRTIHATSDSVALNVPK